MSDSSALYLTLRTKTHYPSRGETMSLLVGICGQKHVQTGEKNLLYCDASPGYPDNDQCRLDIGEVLHGHFTSPKADEVVADYRGCEPHASNYGGSILLRKEDGIWRRIAYFPGERAQRCLVFPRRDGRDALVCVSASDGQGEEDAEIKLRSLKPGVKPESLLGVYSREGAAFCEGFAVGERQIHTRLRDWVRLPATQGTPERLVVQVETEDFVTPGFCGKPPRDEDPEDPLNDQFGALRAQHRRLETVTFNWNGERFVKKRHHEQQVGSVRRR